MPSTLEQLEQHIWHEVLGMTILRRCCVVGRRSGREPVPEGVRRPVSLRETRCQACAPVPVREPELRPPGPRPLSISYGGHADREVLPVLLACQIWRASYLFELRLPVIGVFGELAAIFVSSIMLQLFLAETMEHVEIRVGGSIDRMNFFVEGSDHEVREVNVVALAARHIVGEEVSNMELLGLLALTLRMLLCVCIVATHAVAQSSRRGALVEGSASRLVDVQKAISQLLAAGHVE